MDGLDREPVRILQQAGDVPNSFRHVQGNDAVAVFALVIHVNDGDRKSLVEFGTQQ